MSTTHEVGQFAERGRPPYDSWMSAGLPCAIYVTHYGTLNGYVRLPPLHPDRAIAELAVEMDPITSFQWPDGRWEYTLPAGYDYITVDVHGGWTYGPDLEGWVGFDTMHAGDIWERRLRDELMSSVTDQRMLDMYEAYVEIEDKYPAIGMGSVGHFDPRWDIRWSVARVQAVTTNAAVQLAERAREFLAAGGSSSGPTSSS